MSYYSRVSTNKEDLYKVAKAYGWEKPYKTTTVKTMEAYLLQVAERISYWIKSEGMAYGVEMAQRNGVRYILLPGVEQWEMVRKNMSGRGQLEAFRTILRREFQWTSKKLDEVCASIREHGEWSPLPNVSEEVKYYERVCLSAYALSQVGKGIDYQRTK